MVGCHDNAPGKPKHQNKEIHLYHNKKGCELYDVKWKENKQIVELYWTIFLFITLISEGSLFGGWNTDEKRENITNWHEIKLN